MISSQVGVRWTGAIDRIVILEPHCGQSCTNMEESRCWIFGRPMRASLGLGARPASLRRGRARLLMPAHVTRRIADGFQALKLRPCINRERPCMHHWHGRSDFGSNGSRVCCGFGISMSKAHARLRHEMATPHLRALTSLPLRLKKYRSEVRSSDRQAGRCE